MHHQALVDEQQGPPEERPPPHQSGSPRPVGILHASRAGAGPALPGVGTVAASWVGRGHEADQGAQSDGSGG